MRHCIRCDEWKNESEFNIRNEERGYLQSVCRNCQKEQGRDRYANNMDRVKEINNNARLNSKQNAINFVKEYLYQNPCRVCGETDIAILTFDHVRGMKKYNISGMIQGAYGVEAIRREIEKTDVVCFNCHMKREQKRRGSWRLK
jgi:hypothetical protein